MKGECGEETRESESGVCLVRRNNKSRENFITFCVLFRVKLLHLSGIHINKDPVDERGREYMIFRDG